MRCKSEETPIHHPIEKGGSEEPPCLTIPRRAQPEHATTAEP